MATVPTETHSSPDQRAHHSRSRQPADLKDAAVHSWPDSALTESRAGLWIARFFCLVVSGVFIASLVVMSRGRWPSEELKRSCSDPHDKSVGCADLEGQSSANFNVH